MDLKKAEKKKRIIVGKTICFLIILCLIGFIIFFMKKNDKTINLGNNNINQSANQCVENILNMSSYKAKMEVTVKSNKNTNRYQLNQEYRENYARQIIEEPSNIKGLTITQEENNLKIENTKLNLTSIYENYTYVAENHLFLNYFVEDYKNAQNSNAKEENDFIVLETDCRNQENKYNIRKKLYLQKNTGKPIKMEVQDMNQKIRVYILYNEIEINGTNF